MCWNKRWMDTSEISGIKSSQKGRANKHANWPKLTKLQEWNYTMQHGNLYWYIHVWSIPLWSIQACMVNIYWYSFCIWLYCWCTKHVSHCSHIPCWHVLVKCMCHQWYSSFCITTSKTHDYLFSSCVPFWHILVKCTLQQHNNTTTQQLIFTWYSCTCTD